MSRCIRSYISLPSIRVEAPVAWGLDTSALNLGRNSQQRNCPYLRSAGAKREESADDHRQSKVVKRRDADVQSALPGSATYLVSACRPRVGSLVDGGPSAGGTVDPATFGPGKQHSPGPDVARGDVLSAAYLAPIVLELGPEEVGLPHQAHGGSEQPAELRQASPQPAVGAVSRTATFAWLSWKLCSETRVSRAEA